MLDSFILYSLIRSKKPKKIVEIGYGATSKIIVKALEKNINNLDAQFYSIDPFIKNINRINNNSINIFSWFWRSKKKKNQRKRISRKFSDAIV